MPFENKRLTKDSKVNQESNPQDGYEDLDFLMQDLMGTGGADSKIDSQVDREEYYEDIKSEEVYPVSHVDQAYTNDEEDSYESQEDLYEGKAVIAKNKRVPLFMQMGLKNEIDDKVKAVERAEQPKEEVVETISTPKKRGRGLLGSIGVAKEVHSVDSKDDNNSRINAEKIVKNPIEKTAEEIPYRKFNQYPSENTDSEQAKEEVYSENSVGLGNSFDNMLSDLTGNDDEEFLVEKIIESKDIDGDKSILDKDVQTPLNKPGMNEIKVTADGRTLADMIPGLRSGARPVNSVIKSIESQSAIMEVGDKKFSDNRYKKHIKEVVGEKAVQDNRRKLSNKFLQRNAKFSEQEKIIMKNLGVTNAQFAGLLGSKELTKKQKADIIGLGKYGAEKYFKGRRYRTTIGDTAMLEFLAKFKFANTRILRWISNEPQGRTWRKLSRLKENGLVEDKAIIGVPNLWGATPAGIALSGYNYGPGLRPMPKMLTISSTMGINYLAACLWFNTVNVLDLEDFPAKNRVIPTQEDGRDRVKGEMLISELEIRSSLGKEISPGSTTMQRLGDERLYDVISAEVRQAFEQWRAGGKEGESPEFSLGNEFMWVLYPVGELTMAYHVPDLVVQRERGEKGEPRSIAIELERHEKDSSRYDKIMRAYKLDENLYETVIWITQSSRIARAIDRSARDVGLTKYKIIPILTETGVFSKQDIWMI